MLNIKMPFACLLNLCISFRLEGEAVSLSCNLRLHCYYLLTTRSWVLLEKLTGPQLVKISSHFMAHESSLPHSLKPATCPYPKPALSSPYPHIPLSEDIS